MEEFKTTQLSHRVSFEPSGVAGTECDRPYVYWVTSCSPCPGTWLCPPFLTSSLKHISLLQSKEQ